MARYYKGAGVGTYWHVKDALIAGFTAGSAGLPPSITTLKDHILHQLVTSSPYISLTRSFEIAETYAKYYGNAYPSASNPAYVYELEIPDSKMATLIDPIQEIAKSLGTPFAHICYQHDGAQDILLGLVDTANFGHVLTRHVRGPGKPLGRGPNLSEDLHALVRALRDAEVLAQGSVSKACIIQKFSLT